uniref:Putative secreted peptide n=1 Tax=Anopheles braziliensis TaxID=58242 RepID=A0A2M3ZR71_9DIPT
MVILLVAQAGLLVRLVRQQHVTSCPTADRSLPHNTPNWFAIDRSVAGTFVFDFFVASPNAHTHTRRYAGLTGVCPLIHGIFLPVAVQRSSDRSCSPRSDCFLSLFR